MASPLLGIPGARRGRGGARPGDRNRGRSVNSIAVARAPLPLERRRRRPFARLSEGPAGWAVKPLVLVLLLGGAFLWWRSTWVSIALAEDNPGLAFPSAKVADAPLRFTVSGGDEVRALLSGVEVAEVVRTGTLVEVRLPAGLPEGGYEVELVVERSFPFGSTSARRPVLIDNRPPDLAFDAAPAPALLDEPVTLSGVVEPAASLRVDDPWNTPVTLGAADGGTFTMTFAHPPAGQVTLVAADAAGNETALAFAVPVAYPNSTRAAHITAVGWASDEVRLPFMKLVDRGLVDAVQLDIKDEAGIVGYDSQVPLARQIGAVQPSYDVADALAELHAKGVRVIGRIVAFRDPVLADWAWANGHRDWVLQDPKGGKYAAYGGFANYANQAVRDYNLALAEEAARAGFDEILWDYVRRPEGDPAEMVVPSMTGTGRTTGDMIVEFLGQGQALLRPLGVYQGASVFGIAATRPENIGQPIDRIATVVDYVAPMIYPSHYVDGECGVTSPRREPYAIVACSLKDFKRVMGSAPAVLVPWLQDFSLDGIRYGAPEVAAQVRAATDAGARGFLLWNPSANYAYNG